MDFQAEPRPFSGLRNLETSFAEEFYPTIQHDDFFDSASEFDSLGQQEDKSVVEEKKTKKQQKEKANQIKSIKSLEIATFALKFKNHLEVEPFLQVRKKHSLVFSNKPLYGSFDIIVRRRFYENNPILLNDTDSVCPFKIMSPHFQTEYKPITFPPDGIVSHQGATVKFIKAMDISISFKMASSYVTYDEKQTLNMKMHTAKHLELRCLDSSNGTTLGIIYFQTKITHPKGKIIDPDQITTEQDEQVPPSKRARPSSDPLLTELQEINSKLSTIIYLLHRRQDN